MSATDEALTALHPVRRRMVDIGNLLEAHASQFAYSQQPDRAEIYDLTLEQLTGRLLAGETIVGDCSSTYEATRKDAGCINLPPLGWTGSELATMPHITLAAGLTGDAVVFGESPGDHVVWLTESHPTNPKVAIHWDPETDGHGMPGFTQMRLQELWAGGFPGKPITVLSLAPFLPPLPPADPHHYAYYDITLVKDLPHGPNRERTVVETYDRERRKLSPSNAVLVGRLEDDLKVLHQRAVNNKKGKSAAYIAKHHLDFRIIWLDRRAKGERVA